MTGPYQTPGSLRIRPPEDARDREYSIIEWQSTSISTTAPGSSAIREDQKLGGPGDHLTVLAIEGGRQISVQLGNERGNFIPVREGDVITRSFDFFKVRCDNLVLLESPGYAHALFGVSFGPLIERLPLLPGFGPGMICVNHTANGAPRPFLDRVNWGGNTWGAANQAPAWFRYSGTMRIHNRSASDSVYLFEGNPAALAAAFPVVNDTSLGLNPALFGWEIEPGQKEEFFFRCGMHFDAKAGTLTTFRLNETRTLYLMTTGANVETQLLFSSSSRDRMDPDSEAGALQPPGGPGPRPTPWGGPP